MPSFDPCVLSLSATAAPHRATQGEARTAALELFRDADFDVERGASVFDNAGIARRGFALPLDAYGAGLDGEARNGHFLSVATAMLRDAADDVLTDDVRGDVTHVVTISSTGIATPSLECEVIEALGISNRARRVPVFGLGCAGGVAGLSIARDLAASSEDALVLLLCVELTSLTLFVQDRTLRNLVACAIFGDGAAAALVGRPAERGRPLVRLGRSETRLFPDTRDLMGWDVREGGWRVVFSPRIPAVVRANVPDLVAAVATREELRHFALHPGGRKVLEAYGDALDVSAAELGPATRTLRDHGNMSAATVFFVLDELLAADPEPGPGVATAFGPGFSAEALALDVLRGPEA